MLTPSSNIFLMRNILHLYNKSQNESVKDNLRKIVSPNDQLTLNCNGQVIVGKIFLITMFFVRALLRIYIALLLFHLKAHLQNLFKLMRNLLETKHKETTNVSMLGFFFNVKPDVCLFLFCFFKSIYSYFYMLLNPYIKVHNASTFIPYKDTPPEPVPIDDYPSGDETQRDNRCKHVVFLQINCNLMLNQMFL